MNLLLLWIYMYSFNCGCPFLNIEWTSLAKNYMYMLKLYTIMVKIPLLLKYINTNFKLSKFHKNWNYAWVRLVNLNMSLTLNFSLALCCMRFYMFSIKHLVTHRARYLFRHLRIIKKRLFEASNWKSNTRMFLWLYVKLDVGISMRKNLHI